MYLLIFVNATFFFNYHLLLPWQWFPSLGFILYVHCVTVKTVFVWICMGYVHLYTHLTVCVCEREKESAGSLIGAKLLIVEQHYSVSFSV